MQARGCPEGFSLRFLQMMWTYWPQLDNAVTQDTAHTCIHIYVLFNICSWRVWCCVQQVHHSELRTKWQQWHRLTNAPLSLALASFSSVSSTQLLFYCDQTYPCFESDHLGAVNINWTFCISLWSFNTCRHLYCWTVLLLNTTGSCCEK